MLRKGPNRGGEGLKQGEKDDKAVSHAAKVLRGDDGLLNLSRSSEQYG